MKLDSKQLDSLVRIREFVDSICENHGLTVEYDIDSCIGYATLSCRIFFPHSDSVADIGFNIDRGLMMTAQEDIEVEVNAANFWREVAFDLL